MAKRLNKKILPKILAHKNVNASKPVVQNQLSKIRRDNAGVTLNAAAQAYAASKGFSLMTYLDDADRTSLQFLKSDKSNNTQRPNGKKIRTPKGIKPVFGKNFVDAANHNAKIYPHIYVLENNLRQVIMDSFKNKKDWWEDKKIVHPDIQKEAITIKKAESKYTWMPPRGNHPIFYVGLYELFKIIEQNWKIFKKVFNNLEDLRTWMKEMVSIRHLLAHNIKTRKIDFENAKIRTSHIGIMIKKSYS